MPHLELLIPGLFVAVAALSVVARAISVPYPILLMLGGLALGFVPGVPPIELPSELVLAIFLPPLLYSAAFFSSLRDLRANVRPISLLAVGLVLVTMCGVAVAFHALVPEAGWAVAFVLGAIVSPTDPLAATAIARRLGVPRRIVTVVEGESLVNDGTALVAYRFAVLAAGGAAFSLGEATLRFLLSAAGGVAIGLAVGWVVAEVRRRLDDTPVEITLSLVTGYAAYVPAEELELSGVLAAVTVGIYVGWRAPEISTANMRLQGFAVWELLVFLLNALLFILVGLQLPGILEDLAGRSELSLLGSALLVGGIVIGVRMLWMHTVPYLIRALDRRPSQRVRRSGWRERTIIGWSGMRGAVSLAAALALAPNFPERDLIVWLTFAVIFLTLVCQGLTLPPLIRRLGVCDDGAEEREEIHARLESARAALARLDGLGAEEWTRDETVERMRGLYGYRLRRFSVRAGKVEDDEGIEDRSAAYQRMVHAVIDAQRATLVRLRNEGVISNDVMHRLERELDLEEARLEI